MKVWDSTGSSPGPSSGWGSGELLLIAVNSWPSPRSSRPTDPLASMIFNKLSHSCFDIEALQCLGPRRQVGRVHFRWDPTNYQLHTTQKFYSSNLSTNTIHRPLRRSSFCQGQSSRHRIRKNQMLLPQILLWTGQVLHQPHQTTTF